MSVIHWLVMQEVCCRLNLPAILNLILPGHPLLYAHAKTTTSDEHSIVTMLRSTRIIFSTYSFNRADFPKNPSFKSYGVICSPRAAPAS